MLSFSSFVAITDIVSSDRRLFKVIVMAPLTQAANQEEFLSVEAELFVQEDIVDAPKIGSYYFVTGYLIPNITEKTYRMRVSTMKGITVSDEEENEGITAPPPFISVFGVVKEKNNNFVTIEFETWDPVVIGNVSALLKMDFTKMARNRVEIIKINQYIQIFGTMIDPFQIKAESFTVIDSSKTATVTPSKKLKFFKTTPKRNQEKEKNINEDMVETSPISTPTLTPSASTSNSPPEINAPQAKKFRTSTSKGKGKEPEL